MTKQRSSTAAAHRLIAVAKLKRNTADHLSASDPSGARWNRIEADEMDSHAAAALALTEAPEIGTGGELLPQGEDALALPGIVETVKDPTRTTLNASRDRLDLASDAGAFDLAADAAETIKARNALEKMLAHQIAAAHALAMRLTGRAAMHCNNARQDGFGPQRLDFHAQESTRASFAAARMMDAFQRGLLTLQRLRTGGKQTVVVQHVSVGDGGQAIVAGKLRAGGARGGRRRRGAKSK